MCDFTEMDPYIAELRAMHAQADSILSRLERGHFSPATKPALPPVDHPLDRFVAGDSNMEKCA